MTESSVERLNELAEEVGNFIQYWGFKRVHGKVWTHLYLSSEPLDAGALRERLSISKSLVSITLNDLVKHKVVLKRGKGPKDTDVYTCNPEIKSVILGILKRREVRLLEKVSDQFANFSSGSHPPSPCINPERVEALGDMIVDARECLSAMVDLKEFDFSKFKFC